MLNKRISQQLFEKWGQPKIDLFASNKNKQADFFYRKPHATTKPGEGCLGNDAFAAKWHENELLYANPPWELTEKLIAKVKTERIKQIIIISPNCSKELRKMSISKPIRLSHTKDLFIPPSQQGVNEVGVGLPHWKNTFAYLISGDPKPDAIPLTTKKDSRFIMKGTIANHNANILVDSGCTTNVISSDFIEKFKVITSKIEGINLRFGNGNKARSSKQVTLEFVKNNYTRKITFLVHPIKHDAIIGTPWFEEVEIYNLDWRHRCFEFHDTHSGTNHNWSNIKKNRKLPYLIHCNINELERDTVWVASIPLTQLTTTEECSEIEHRGAYKMESTMQESPKSLIEKTKIEDLTTRFSSVFKEPTELPPSRPEDHRIKFETDSKMPPWRPLGRLSQYELETLKEMLTKLIEKGFITHSNSPFGANILFAKKSDGSLRLCIDYRFLNAITVKDRTPLPNIKEMQDRLGSAKYFTKLDLKDGFYNILIHPEDRHKTAFRTRYGHFEFVVLPMGLTNSPGTFMRMMNRIFGLLYDKCVIAYVDDILIYSETYDQHLIDLEAVFTLLQSNTLFLKSAKCQFAMDSVDFCGTTVSSNGIHLDQSKLEPLFNTPAPKTVKQLQSLLGICNWFRDFIPEFSLIAAPLTELTKKDNPWLWTPLHQSSMMLLLYRIATAPCLRYFNPDLETFIYTDASLYGLGGWIGQKHDDGIHPIMFWSRKLIPAEIKYHTHERELLALVEITKKARHYLLGHPAIANTDHRALIFLQSQPRLSVRQANWVEHLQQFDIKIEYLPGIFNFLADCLSRNPEFTPKCPKCDGQVDLVNSKGEIVLIEHEELDNIEEVVDLPHDKDELPIPRFSTDPLRIAISKEFPKHAGTAEKLEKHWLLSEGLLYYGNRLFIPTEFRADLLHDNHSTAAAGHLGFQKTLNRIAKLYYWPTMRVDCHEFARNCTRCQLTKKSTAPKRAVLQPLEIPTEAFKSVHLDFFPAPLNSQKEDNVLVIVDKTSKIVELIPCKRTSTAIDIADLFFKNWLCRGYPLPNTIFSDRDSKFISSFWKQLMVSMGVKLALPTARHQQTNSTAEHVVKQAKICLRALGRPNLWQNDLPAIAFALNSAVHSTTGFAPFHLALGLDSTAKNPWHPYSNDKAILDKAISNSLQKTDQAETHYNRKATAYETLSGYYWTAKG